MSAAFGFGEGATRTVPAPGDTALPAARPPAILDAPPFRPADVPATSTRRARAVPKAFGAFVLNGLLGVALGVVLLFLASIPLGYRSLTVMSGSMEPTLHVGDVVLERQVAPSGVRVGDIVTFRAPDEPSTLVTHRVRSLSVHDGVVDVVTKGDANNSVERWTIPVDGGVGLVRFRLPRAGFALAWASGRAGRIALIAIPAAVLGILELVRIWRPRRTAGT